MNTTSDKVQIPVVEYRRGIYFLVLDGETPYERGFQHGTALEFPIKKAMRQFRNWIRANVGLEEPDDMIQDFAANTPYLDSVKALVPDLYEELRGTAEGAGVDLNELFVYQSFDEFFVFLLTSGSLEMGTTGHCTTAGVYGRPDKPNYVGHNNDIPTYHEELVTVLHIKKGKVRLGFSAPDTVKVLREEARRNAALRQARTIDAGRAEVELCAGGAAKSL